MELSLTSFELNLLLVSALAGFVVALVIHFLLRHAANKKSESLRDGLSASIAEQQGLQVKVTGLTAQLEKVESELQRQRELNGVIGNENAALKSRLESEQRRFQEQLQLLQETRENLNREFENLANRIFEEKQQSFTQSSKQSLEATVNPLRQEITAFRKKVEDAYEKENAERNRLIGQVEELQKQAQRVSEDAVNLANALKGQSKFQGNWGEIILERLLEESGLTQGREYETQVTLKTEEGQRRNPDVVVHLPDQRDIVIDAKVSLTDYERYCREEQLDRKQQFLKQHIASLRAHINGLNRKAYEQLVGVNSLDFVLIFVPIEAAFMLALEQDHTLFRDAYDKGIILVSPTTLLATLRTIHNIWRYEAQNRNAEQIAENAGKLYDQLVLVAESLEETGKYLDRTQQAWQTTRNRLVEGRGNLVKRVEEFREMGARARKQLPKNLLDDAEQQHDSARKGNVTPLKPVSDD